MNRSFSLMLAALVLAAAPLAGSSQTPTPAPEAAPPPAAAPAPANKFTYITPYGFILTNVFFNSRAFSADDYAQYAVNPSATNDRGILFSSRYNRIGVKVGGLEAIGAKLAAVLEMDFGAAFYVTAGQNVQQGTQAANFDFYRPLMRFRSGFVTATWGNADSKFTLLTGQDYGLLNPVNAVSLGYTGSPLFQNAGNLYTRAPQVRLTAEMGKDAGITVAVAAIDPLDQNTFVQGANQETPTLSAGNRSRIPQLEGRFAGRFKSPMASGEVGFSGSYHKERYILGTFVPATAVPATGATAPAPTPVTAAAFNPNGGSVDVDSLIGGVDAVFKFPFVEVRGEGFIGHNLDMYYGHLGQGGTNAVTVAGSAPGSTTLTNVQNKRTKGFWVQGILSPIDSIQLTGGYGVETPFNEDIAVGNRSRNSIASAGIIWSASKALKFSAEGAYTYTTTKGTPTGFDTKLNGYQTVLSSQFIF